MKVSQIMTKKVVTTDPYTTAAGAFMQMVENGFRHLPVVDNDGEIWGLISMSDLRETLRLRQGDQILTVDNFKNRELVKDVLKSKAIVVADDTDIREVARVMVDKKIGGLPVIHRQNGRLVGIVTQSDILATFVEFMNQIADSQEICVNLPQEQKYLDRAMSDLKQTGAEVLGVSMSKGTKRGTKDYLFRVQTKNIQKLRQTLSKRGYTILNLA